MTTILLILLITQIIIESLPISSSGHVALIEILSQKFFGSHTILPDFIDNLLHGTALLAILIVFFKDWFYPVKKLAQCVWQKISNSKPLTFSQKKLLSVFLKIAGLIFLADLTTSIFYMCIKILFKDFFQNLGPMTLLAGFTITMLLLFSLKLKNTNSVAQSLDYKKALVLGCVQGIALLPGISRFASTYVAGCWLNLRPARAFQISFLLHLPLIVAAFTLQGLPALFKHPQILQNLNIINVLIILLATTLAIALLNMCYSLAVKNKLWWFGIYMLIPIMIMCAMYSKILNN